MVGTAAYRDWLPGSVVVLNAMDAVFTLVWVYLGLAVEANAFMAGLLDHSPVAFMATKVAMVSTAVWFLRSRAGHPAASFGMKLALAVYVAVTLWHMRFAKLAFECAGS